MAESSSSQQQPASSSPDYCREYLPDDVVEKLEAGAFRSLCKHLQERSDAVQNMDLMTLSGFCRNCLAKWMVLEARRMVDAAADTYLPVHALNAMGYDEAAQHVYGMTYPEWKKRHQKKATDQQMERYNQSKPLHASHDKNLLAVRAEKPPPEQQQQQTGAVGEAEASAKGPSSLLSDVCCQDVEEVSKQATPQPAKQTRAIGPFQPPPLPILEKAARVGILTVSDRAYNNEYETGDLSGPAVAKAVAAVVTKDNVEAVSAIVPDDLDAIQSQLRSWCDEDRVDLILTTGGTGMSPRDVTPEATCGILDQECAGLMAFVTTECSRLQPLASLSRGTAGIRGTTVIANLPGNPKGVGEVVPILLPLLLHAVVDLRAS